VIERKTNQWTKVIERKTNQWTKVIERKTNRLILSNVPEAKSTTPPAGRVNTPARPLPMPSNRNNRRCWETAFQQDLYPYDRITGTTAGVTSQQPNTFCGVVDL